jgi:hypothetical protein
MSFGEQYNIEIRKPADLWDTSVNPDIWVPSVENILRKIANSKAGQALFYAIFDSGHWVFIRPLEKGTDCNAFTYSAPRQVIGTRAYWSVILFDPQAYAKGSRCYHLKLGDKYTRGGLPNEVLFHELVHAMRQCTALRQPTDLAGGLYRYVTDEEFFAVVIANIYISEGAKDGSSGLRSGEIGKSPLESYFSNSLCFFASSTQILPLMKRFKKDHEQLFTDLSMINCTFNPVKALLETPKTVEAISKAKATAVHEAGAEKHQKWLKDQLYAELKSLSSHEKQNLEKAISDVMNASPNQVANQIGSLGKQALQALGI